LAVKGNYRFVWSDLLVPVAAVWMFVGPAVNDGFGQTVKFTGSQALEFCVPYMATRTYLTERGQAVALVRVLGIAIAIVGLLAIFDEVSGRFLIRETVALVTGYVAQSDRVDDYQRGLLFRAAGTLEHPIMLGSASVFGLLMATTIRGATRTFVFFGCAVGLVLSVSSAAFSGGLIGSGVLLYEKFTRKFPFRWAPAIIVPLALLIALYVSHPDPIGFLLGHFTFNPQTGWYRRLQWDCAGGLVLDSPTFGIGLSDDWASWCGLDTSIDSLWLLAAMRYGIPGSILLFLCYVGASSLSVGIEDRELNLTRQERQLAFTLTLILGVVIFIGFTVYYWGSVFILTMFLTGIRAHLGALGSKPREHGLDDDG